MVTRLLNLSGLDLGAEVDLVPAAGAVHQPWENLQFSRTNDALLSVLGGGWDMVPAFPAGWCDLPLVQPHRRQADQLVRSFTRPHWGWKDPCNSLLLDFWQAVLPQMKVLICVRNPLDVARSLQARGPFSQAFALDLWYRYNRRILDLIEPGRRVVTHYDAYFADAPAELRRVLALLDLPLNDAAITSAVATVDPRLRHSAATLVELEHATLRDEIPALYASLCREAGELAMSVVGDLSSLQQGAAACSYPSASAGHGASVDTTTLRQQELTQQRAAERDIARTQRAIEDLAKSLDREAQTRARLNAILKSPTWRVVSGIGTVWTRLGLIRPTPANIPDDHVADFNDAAGTFPPGVTAPPEPTSTPAASPETNEWGPVSVQVPQLSSSPLYLLDQVRIVWRNGGWRAVWAAYLRRREIQQMARRNPRQAASSLPISFAEAAAKSRRNVTVYESLREVIDACTTRLGRRPAILDWDTRFQLAAAFPGETVFSPASVNHGTLPLPYIDASVDLVVLDSNDPAMNQEAVRIAAGAVVRIDGEELQTQWIAPTPGELSRVSIIIPVYNGWSTTRDCLDSIHATLPADFTGEILIMDDLSSDQTAQGLQQYCREHPLVKHHRNTANLGFVGNCNRGAELASGDMLVFVNNDTITQPNWLARLLGTFMRYPDAGAVGGKLIYPDGRLQEAGGVIFRDGSGANFGKGDTNASGPLYSFVREVDYVSGALLATPKALFDSLQGFDPIFKPAYYEDTDYCFRVRQAGKKVYYQPASVLVHLEGYSCGTDEKAGIKQHQVVNRQTFCRRWETLLKAAPEPPARFDFETWYELAMRGPVTHA